MCQRDCERKGRKLYVAMWRKKKLVPRGVTDDQMPLLSTAAQTEPWTPYEAIRNHPADFRVKYRLYRPEEGGRKRPPRQGYRSDFAFDEDDLSHPKLYMIFPELEDYFSEISNAIARRGWQTFDLS